MRAAIISLIALTGTAGCSAPSKPAEAVDPRPCRCPSTQPDCCVTSLSSDAVPRFFPSYTKACASTEFRDVMTTQFNASLSVVSQALFHDVDDGRLDRVADAAAVILGCAKQFDHHRPAKVAPNDWTTFDHMMIQLVMNTHALQSAALEDDPEIVIHWYHHLKQSCAACHARFNEE